jgi:CubicO group peptidase (beta-lactamase class C family)
MAGDCRIDMIAMSWEIYRNLSVSGGFVLLQVVCGKSILKDATNPPFLLCFQLLRLLNVKVSGVPLARTFIPAIGVQFNEMIDYQKLDAHITDYIGPDSILGMALAIVQGDTVVYRNGFGQTSVEDAALPVTANTVFAIGSTSKTINALMIMRLVERGVLDLDRPVVDYLRGFVFASNPEWGKQITLRHLLGHTSGLASGGKAWGPRDPAALRRWVWEEISQYGLIAPPGTVPYYANGPSVAGHVAEVVTGAFFTQLISSEVFAPLGMSRSTYDRRIAMTHPLALPHVRDEAGKLSTVHLYADNPAGNPEGFCLSTAEDLAKLLIMFLNGGRYQQQQYLSRDSLGAMETVQGDYRAKGLNDVRAAMIAAEGLGLSMGHYKGVRTLGHSGMLQGMMTMFDFFPERGIGVVSLVNHCNVEKRNELLFSLFDQLLETPPSYHFPALPTNAVQEHNANLSLYAGVYLAPYGQLVWVDIRGNELVLSRDGETFPLTPIGVGKYLLKTQDGPQLPVTFLTEKSGPAQTVLLYPDPYRRIMLDANFALDKEQIALYTGLYANYREGDIIEGFYVGIKDGTLFISPAEDTGSQIALDESRGETCTPLSQTRFVTGSGLYDFTLSVDGAVTYVTKDFAFRYWPQSAR